MIGTVALSGLLVAAGEYLVSNIVLGAAQGEAQNRLRAMVKARLAAMRGNLPANHDIARSLRKAQLDAVGFVLTKYRANSADSNGHVAFLKAAENGLRAARRAAAEMDWSVETDAALFGSFEAAFQTDTGRADGLEATELSWKEVLSWTEGTATPWQLQERFFGQTAAASWWEGFTAGVSEAGKANDRFRSAFLEGKLVTIDRRIVEAEEVWARVAEQTADTRADMNLVVKQMQEGFDGVQTTLVAHGQKLAKIIERLDAAGLGDARKAVLTEDQFHALVTAFALEGTPTDKVAETLIEEGRRLRSLEARLADRVDDDDEVLGLKATARSAIEIGEFARARDLLLRIAEHHRQAAERAEASYRIHCLAQADALADAASLEFTRHRPLDAAELFARAAQTAAHIDRLRAWRLRIRQARALAFLGECAHEEAVRQESETILIDEALPLVPRDDNPVEFGITHRHLANLYLARARGLKGDDRTREADRASDSADLAISLIDVQTNPTEWAGAAHVKAQALSLQAVSMAGETAANLHAGAFQILDQALSHSAVTNRELRHRLMIALAESVRRVAGLRKGEAAIGPLARALSILDAVTPDPERTMGPIEWAVARNNAAQILSQLAGLESAKSADHLERALVAYSDAIEVYRDRNLPAYWAESIASRAPLVRGAALAEGDTAGPEKLDALIADLRHAEEVTRTKEHGSWRAVQLELGLALADSLIVLDSEVDVDLCRTRAAEALDLLQDGSASSFAAITADYAQWYRGEVGIVTANLCRSQFDDDLALLDSAIQRLEATQSTLARVSMEAAEFHAHPALALQRQILLQVADLVRDGLLTPSQPSTG